MAEVVPESSATPSEECKVAFSALGGADRDQVDEWFVATLEQCSPEDWHQMNAVSQVDWPVTPSADPEQTIAELCEHAEWAQACAQFTAG